MSRILVVSTDYFGASMAGPAIRCWEMARVLTAHGHQVRVAGKMVAADAEPAGFEIFAATDDSLEAAAEWSDVIVVQGLALFVYPVLRKADRCLLVDIYDPFNLEILELFRDHPLDERLAHHQGQYSALGQQLRRGDFFVCASERQRDYWLGALTTAGRVNPYTHGADDQLRALIDVAPFGISGEMPQASGTPAARGVLPGIEEDARLVIWGGGIYNWFDPLSLLRAWPEVVAEVPSARLLFMGVKHPNADVPAMSMVRRAIDLSEELGLRDRTVHFNLGWVPYERRRDFLLEADLGVSMHYNHVETAFSFRTRVLDYIWAGLPIVATEGDSFAAWIEATGAGRVVPYEDPGAIARAIIGLLADRDALEACRGAVQRERPSFTWEEALRPVVEYCHHPYRAPDLVARSRERLGELPDSLQNRGLPARALYYLRSEGPVTFANRAYRGILRRLLRRAGEEWVV